jgi:hypothetical protein
MDGLTEIDRLEAPLREAHAMRIDTFQAFVNWLRSPACVNHPLRATAIAYNQAVYEMQNHPIDPWKD